MTAEPAATVFVVDDDASVLRAVGRLMRSAGFAVEAFSSATQFLDAQSTAAAAHALPACVILDVTMPEFTGPAVQQRLLAAGNRLPVVFLTGNGDLPTGIRAMKDGAVDFLTKPCGDEELLAAVRRALAIDDQSRAEQNAHAAAVARFATLTPREHEVMLGVVAGKPNKRIALDLGIAEATIKIHRGRVMEKLGAESLADLIRMARTIESGQKST